MASSRTAHSIAARPASSATTLVASVSARHCSSLKFASLAPCAASQSVMSSRSATSSASSQRAHITGKPSSSTSSRSRPGRALLSAMAAASSSADTPCGARSAVARIARCRACAGRVAALAGRAGAAGSASAWTVVLRCAIHLYPMKPASSRATGRPNSTSIHSDVAGTLPLARHQTIAPPQQATKTVAAMRACLIQPGTVWEAGSGSAVRGVDMMVWRQSLSIVACWPAMSSTRNMHRGLTQRQPAVPASAPSSPTARRSPSIAPAACARTFVPWHRG